MNTLTFVYGETHYQATLYIREQVNKHNLPASRFRNITNPETLIGLRSTEKTTVEFVWLPNCHRNKTFEQFQRVMAGHRGRSGIVEIQG